MKPMRSNEIEQLNKFSFSYLNALKMGFMGKKIISWY
jgi:hypothetical protein